MCFSAQIEGSYAKSVRMTGAQIDLEQYMELYGIGVYDPSIKIPRAVDRWFDNPKPSGE